MKNIAGIIYVIGLIAVLMAGGEISEDRKFLTDHEMFVRTGLVCVFAVCSLISSKILRGIES